MMGLSLRRCGARREDLIGPLLPTLPVKDRVWSFSLSTVEQAILVWLFICHAREIIMANDPHYQVLLDRIEALEARERQLTVTSHAYQVVLTTLLGNLDVQTRDRIITMVDEAHEIAYSQAVNRSDRHLSEVIKGADEVVQRMFNYAQGNPHSEL